MGEVLFCPFCRESFEGQDQCPEHELELVPWLQLPESRAKPAQDGPLGYYDLRWGRGWVLLGACLMVVAFFLPFAHLSGDVEAQNSLYQLAGGRSARLWLVPTACFAQVWTLLRRRTPAALRGARLVVMGLSLLPAGVAATTLVGIREAAGQMARRGNAHVVAEAGIAVYLIGVAALLMFWGGLRLGVLQDGGRAESGR